MSRKDFDTLLQVLDLLLGSVHGSITALDGGSRYEARVPEPCPKSGFTERLGTLTFQNGVLTVETPWDWQLDD